MSWLNSLLGRKVFTPLESRLLQEVQHRLAPAVRQLLAEQLRRINLAQRHAKGREVCFYTMRGRRPERDESIRLPATHEELKFATLQFEVPGEGTFVAEFHIVSGYFFSIEFTPAPTRITERTDFAVQQVQILHDLMTPPPSPRAEGGASVQLAGWLAEVPGLSGLKGPLPEDERARRLAEIEAVLPREYLEAIEVSDGFQLRDLAVLGLAEVYPVVLEDATYYVLARKGDSGVVAVRKPSRDGVVYFLPYDGRATGVGSFRDAILSSLPVA